jgi:subtilase-type serine protease
MLRLSFSALALLAFTASGVAAQDAEYDEQLGLDLINARAAYDLGFTGEGVLVGVLDSGLAIDHPGLAGRISDISLDPFTGGRVTLDYDGHGTHVAGIIAAARDGVGMHGVAFNARVAPFVLAVQSDADVDRVVDEVYRYGLANGVRIFNNSWSFREDYFAGTPDARIAFDTLMTGQVATFRAAVRMDAIIVFSTGNEYQLQPNVHAALPFYAPDLQSNWLAVTAIGRDGGVLDYANNCGLAAAWCLAAPGGDGQDEQIISTLPGGAPGVGAYGPLSGTSMAAPHVTGAVAIARQMFPTATGAEVTRFVLATATDAGAVGVDDVYGWGILNIGNMAAARGGLGIELFSNAAWAADRGMAVLVDSFDARLQGGDPGGWVSLLGGRSRHDETGTANDARADSGGLAAGYDFMVGDATRLGAALGWIDTNLDETDLDNAAKIRTISASVYGAASHGALFVQGAVGLEKRDFDFHRGAIAGAAGTALEAEGIVGRASTNGYGVFADARLGVGFGTGFGQVRPFIHARASHQTIDGFAETGADVFSLVADDVNPTRYQAGPGLEVVFNPISVNSALVSADLGVRYDAGWGDDDYAIEARMLGAAMTGRVGDLDDPVTVSGGVTADFGRVQGSARGFWASADNQSASGLSLGLRMSF